MSQEPRVYERKHKGRSTWTVDLWLTVKGSPGRRRFRQALPQAKTREEALAAGQKLQRALNQRLRAGPPARSVTVREFIADLWLPRRRADWKPATWRGYEQILRVHLLPAFGDIAVGDVSASLIEDYKAAKRDPKVNLDPNTVNKHLGVLSKLLNDALRWGHIQQSPMSKVETCRLDRDPSDFQFWSQAQQEALLAATLRVRPRWYAFVLTSLTTGLRLGELAALRREDIDLEAGVLHVRRAFSNGIETTPKSRKGRRLPLAEDLIPVLRDHLAGVKTDRVFLSNDGEVLTHNNVKSTWRTILRAAELPKPRLHDNRHTFASNLVIADVSLPKVQALLGHSDQRTTQRYAHLSDASLHEAIQRLPGRSKSASPDVK